uniref:Uncharacterized protein n=1 Tax=Romanomermis culicivorax TaxID=13658 RepID=A0A915L0Q2_ROMCU
MQVRSWKALKALAKMALSRIKEGGPKKDDAKIKNYKPKPSTSGGELDRKSLTSAEISKLGSNKLDNNERLLDTQIKGQKILSKAL